MGRGDHALSHGQSTAGARGDAQVIQREQRADRIDNRIHRTHFVKVDVIDRFGPVDTGFGFGQLGECRNGVVADPNRNVLFRGIEQHMSDLGQIAIRTADVIAFRMFVAVTAVTVRVRV